MREFKDRVNYLNFSIRRLFMFLKNHFKREKIFIFRRGKIILFLEFIFIKYIILLIVKLIHIFSPFCFLKLI